MWLNLIEAYFVILLASIEQLHKLKILDVSSNKLTQFTFDFMKMEHLATINLSGNQISNFSVKSKSVHSLDLSLNKISQFPEIPSSVTDLKMSKNQIKDIPDDMQLPHLKNLDLSENQITAIPKSLGSLKLKSKNLFIFERFHNFINIKISFSSQHEAESSQGQEAIQVH